ncbi:MAG: SDR family NAD(P)-dependent oxidoreductase [Candidatus Lokiarchaeota archaeon]|nr:SDR family NAD(P)-dependent oxidoreductase [Candidatus Lokiarchaeota archaeon]
MSKKKWTTEDIPDLTEKVIIVTGANSGIGFEATKEFVRKGAETILACRNEEKASKAFDRIKKEIPDAKIKVMQLDLASLKSIHQFTEEFKKQYSRLDVLLNNAGIMMDPYGTTEDGFERQVGINHLGHFALTGLLFDLIANTSGARVVNVSSNGHRVGNMDFTNFLYKDGKGYTRTGAYGRSKLANLLFTYELDRRFRKANINAIAVAAHPGASRTELGRSELLRIGKIILYPMTLIMSQNAANGALPSIRAAVDPEVQGSDYYGPSGIGEMKGYPIKVESSKASHNEEDAKKLWEISEELTGVKYSI